MAGRKTESIPLEKWSAYFDNLYVRQGMSITNIACRLGRSTQSVSDAFKRVRKARDSEGAASAAE